MSGEYEYPLPVLQADTDGINIETKDSHTGQLTIKNTGGGKLCGRIISRAAGLDFTPREFDNIEQNKEQKIEYSFNAASAELNIGESINSHFFIHTNGGEKAIPFSAKLTKVSISTPDDVTIANIQDFYNYAQQNPAAARRIFTDSEFFVLLMSLGYKYMEVYESLHKDANRERAMDNFFILSGLKEQTTIKILHEDTQTSFSAPPDDNTPLQGAFKVQRSDSGYVDIPMKNTADWLTLNTAKITTSDFNEENTATIGFTIDPANTAQIHANAQIDVGTQQINITYHRQPHITAHLNRSAYRYADSGKIKITNNTPHNMQVSVFCKEAYIKFTAKSYPIGPQGEIPFDIKLSAFMNAQLLFRKTPIMQTAIELTAKAPGLEIKKTLPILVGEW